MLLNNVGRAGQPRRGFDIATSGLEQSQSAGSGEKATISVPKEVIRPTRSVFGVDAGVAMSADAVEDEMRADLGTSYVPGVAAPPGRGTTFPFKPHATRCYATLFCTDGGTKISSSFRCAT